MSNSLEFSPNTRALAEFLGIVSPEAELEALAVPSLAEVMSSPVLATPPPSLNGRAVHLSPARLEFDLDDDMARIIDGLEIADADFAPLPESPEIVLRARFETPPRPRPAPRALARAVSSLASDRFALLFSPPAVERPSHVSRTTPARNPLAASFYDLDPRQSPPSAFQAHLNQVLFGFEHPGQLSVLGPVPEVLPPAIRRPELAYIPKPVGILEATYYAEQDDYYSCLMAASPLTSDLDRVAIAAGKDVYVRDGKTGNVFVVEMGSGKMKCSYSSRELVPTSVAFSPSGKGLLVGTWDGKVEYWRISEKGKCELLCYIPVKGDRNKITAVAFTNGRFIAGTSGGMLYEFDPETGDTIEARNLGNHNICSIAVSPDGKTVAAAVEHKVAGEPEETRLFLLQSNGNDKPEKTNFDLVETPYKGLGHACKIAFSPDGKKLALATGSKNGRLILFQIGKGSCREVPVSCSSKLRENVDAKGRYVLKVWDRERDGTIWGWQATGIHWIKSGKNDLIMATLASGEAVFIPVDRERLAIGNPLTQRIHEKANDGDRDRHGRISHSAVRGGVLYTAAPTELVPGNNVESGAIRLTRFEPEARPKKPVSAFDLASFNIR